MQRSVSITINPVELRWTLFDDLDCIFIFLLKQCHMQRSSILQGRLLQAHFFIFNQISYDIVSFVLDCKDKWSRKVLVARVQELRHDLRLLNLVYCKLKEIIMAVQSQKVRKFSVLLAKRMSCQHLIHVRDVIEKHHEMHKTESRIRPGRT